MRQDVIDRVGGTVEGRRWCGPVVVFAVVYRLGKGGSSGASSGAGAGCLAAVVITLLFFLVVVF